MALFIRKPQPTGPPPERRIPRLEPAYFERIQRAIQAYGGTDSLADVAYGIANAVENTAHQLLDGIEPHNGRKFDKQFGNHAVDDLGAADRMIDWLIRWDPAAQEPLETLLAKLTEVLSKPPASN